MRSFSPFPSLVSRPQPIFLYIYDIYIANSLVMHVSSAFVYRPMAVPVLREKKWRHLDSNLRVHYRVASPSSSP